MHSIFWSTIAILVLTPCFCQDVSDLTQYIPGDIPVILSVPHGGYDDVESIPERIDGCPIEGTTGDEPKEDRCDFEAGHADPSCIDGSLCSATTATAANTIDLAITVADRMEEILGGRPHVVICNLLRLKVDVNRDIDEGAQGDATATQVYQDFHNYIEGARALIGRGILFDILAQSHEQNSTELGYLLLTDELNAGDYDSSKTSIKLLSEETGLTGEELLTGEDSLGTFLEEQGYNALPSPRQPAPGNDDYFSGGYITQLYGSLEGGLTDAIQVASPSEVRIDGGQEGRDNFGVALAEAIALFYRTYYEDVSAFTDYFPGTLPIIISAPHGGYQDNLATPLRLDGCPIEGTTGDEPKEDRCDFEAGHKDPSCIDGGLCGITTVTDSYTIDVATLVADELELLLGGQRPHLVLCQLYRTKVDANREIGEAAQGDPTAVRVYQDFHGYIQQARDTIGRGILFDIHGQGHDQNSTEIGYLLSISELDAGDYNADESSIRLLATETGLSGEELMIGPDSLGGMLEERGYHALPSPRQPSPNGDSYFTGGYITQTYGSREGGLTDAIQLETPSEVRIDAGVDGREAFARALAQTIADYFLTYYA